MTLSTTLLLITTVLVIQVGIVFWFQTILHRMVELLGKIEQVAEDLASEQKEPAE